MEKTITADIEVLLIRLGSRTFGLPLADVRYVATMPADFSSHGSEVQDHFVFEGSPLTYVSLWNTLGAKSLYVEYEEMQAMLPQRQQDHLDWMASLEDSIRTGNPFSKARSHRECAFGKWFYGYHSTDRRIALLLGQFESPHASIHSLADQLLGLPQDEALRALEEARGTTLVTLIKLFETTRQLVIELQRRIAVIVANGDESCALGADAVNDIVTIPAERINRRASNGQLANATAGLIILEDQSVIPLLNWQALSAGQAIRQPEPV